MKHLQKFNENKTNESLSSKLDEVYEILKEEIKSNQLTYKDNGHIEDFYQAEEMIEKSVMRYLGDKLWNDEELIEWMKKREFGE
jgi:DNA-binding GntR family transcriptional regulator